MPKYKVSFERSAVEIDTITVTAVDAKMAEHMAKLVRRGHAKPLHRETVLSGDNESTWELMGVDKAE